MKKKIEDYFYVILGSLFVSIAYDLFIAPNQLVAGGVGGLAIIAKKVLNIEESMFIFLVNVILIIISYIFLGKEKTRNTIFGSLIVPIFIKIFEDIPTWIPLSLDPVIVSLIGGALSGFGYGLIFKQNFTTGGTDILNQMMEKYLKIPMAKSILYVDGFIVLLGWAFFGFANMMYALLALVLISGISNRTQLGINHNRVFYISSSKIEEIKDYLTANSYDVTILNSIGGYSKKNGKMILCSVEEKDYYKIKEGIDIIDPDAFIIIINAYEQLNANITIRSKTKESLD